jgi:hypothetical protein
MEMAEELRIGVFVCECGRNIAGTVDCEAVRAHASTLPDVVIAQCNRYTCSDSGQQQIIHRNRAVDGSRQAGTQHHIPRGLLARAEYYRVTGALDKAKRDLDEAFTIATRGGMGLHLADCHLEYARLALAGGVGTFDKTPLQNAREHLAIAKKMIAEMGYHRRDREVEVQ